MPIRTATYNDLLPASKILSRAFKDEDLFANYMLIHQAQYPDEVHLYFLRSLRVAHVSGASTRILVSYKADAQGQEGCLTGAALWARYTTEKPTLTTTDKVLATAVRTYNYLESFVYPNRAADPAQLDILQRAHPFNKHHWTGTRGEVWTLELLGTDPDFEKQGYGRELVRWGFDRAREEGVGCSVVSSDGRERFYQRCGFDVVAGVSNEFGGEANPLRNVKGGTILFWDNGIEPTGIKKYGEA